MIVTPTVVQKAREFYGCATLQGLELEDKSTSRLSSHWENRVVIGDAMVSYIPAAATFSAFTLALFVDSGWYRVNWEYAQYPTSGRNAGCDWFTEKCIDTQNTGSIASNFPDTFCTETVSASCGSNAIGKFFCHAAPDKLATWPSIPASQQYFSNELQGGSKAYPDYCPMYEMYSDHDCRLWGEHNDGSASEFTELLAGMITGTSKCLHIDGELNGRSVNCYPTQCFRNAPGDAYVGVRITMYRNYLHTLFDVITCWSHESGQAKQFGYVYHERDDYGFDTVFCPDFDNICYDDNPWICNGHGTLQNGTCICSPGYFGVDCTIEANAENREKYSDTHSLSRYVDIVCGGGIWEFSTLDNENVGILRVSMDIDNVEDVDSYYVEAYFQAALKQWISILTENDPCSVLLVDYAHDNISTITTDIHYHSSFKTWTDVSATEYAQVFTELFGSDVEIVLIEELTQAKGDHPDNVDECSWISARLHHLLMMLVLLLVIGF